MAVFIPCLNVDKPDSGGGFSVHAGVGVQGGDVTRLSPGVTFTHSDSPVAFGITPWPPFIFFGPNFAFWADLFGLGETRIDREKQRIQDVLTGIFDYLRRSYDVPVRDNHALQFGSDGVRAQFGRRPDIAALVPSLMVSVTRLAEVVFVDDSPSQGQQERIVNQFLANAAINDWPVSTTVAIWDGMLDAAKPDCSADPARWIKNPYIVLRAAEMALAIKYIGLPTMTNMATGHAIGDPTAERLVLQWADNPQLVSQLTYEQKYPWQGIYERSEWALAPYRYPLGGTIPLYSRDHFRDLISGVQVLRPRYPDFAPQGQGGIQPAPPSVPQPPTPPPTPQPDPTPVPQPPDPTPVPQPPTLEIPTQADYDRACDIMRRMTRREGMLQIDLDWMLTNLGAQAMSWAARQPQCADVPPGSQPLPPDVTQPDCPPDDQPFPPGGQTPVPIPRPRPQPQPYPDPQDPNRPCPPKCQQEIDELRDRLLACCSRLDTWAIPNILEIWRWLTDVERRLPGPPPVLVPAPPRGPVPPPVLEIPPDEPPGENPPGETPPPLFPPGVIDCLIDLCDEEKFCEKTRECERELECVRIPLCDPQGGPWGGMTECWHDKNQTPQRDVYGVYRQAQLPASLTALYQRSYQQAFGIQGQQSGPSQSQGFDPRDPARWDTISDKLAQQYLADYKAGTVTMQRTSVVIPSRPWIFADPDQTDLGQVKIRQPKLRPGEVDPCSVEPGQVLEIPPISN